jgi:hypothetical protein
MAKGMAGFINPNWQKTAGQVVVNAGLRAGAAVGSFWLQKKLTTPKDGQTEAPKYAKYVGPAMFAAGVAGEVFFANPYMISVAEGLTVAGGLMTAKMVLKDKAADYGLSGIGALSPEDVKPLPASVANFDFDAALAEANRINDTNTALPGMSGVYDDEDGEEEGVSGASSRTVSSMF